jgi:hypothetical protein
MKYHALAEQNRIYVEFSKTPDERGKYLHPDAFGQPETMGVNYDRIHKTIGDKR